MRFKLNDNGLNLYGARVLSEGIMLDEFRQNPIMLWNHDRSALPIGRWDDVTVENGCLYATAVFDEADPLAQEIKSKVTQRIINAASISIEPIELSTDPEQLITGQIRPTITKSALREVSLVDLPANTRALRLSNSAFNQANLLPLIKPKTIENQLLTEPVIEKLKLVAHKFGIDTQNNSMNWLERLAVKIENMPKGISELLKTQSGNNNDIERNNWNLRDWEINDPATLKTMRTNQPERYEQLFNAYYMGVKK